MYLLWCRHFCLIDSLFPAFILFCVCIIMADYRNGRLMELIFKERIGGRGWRCGSGRLAHSVMVTSQCMDLTDSSRASYFKAYAKGIVDYLASKKVMSRCSCCHPCSVLVSSRVRISVQSTVILTVLFVVFVSRSGTLKYVAIHCISFPAIHTHSVHLSLDSF